MFSVTTSTFKAFPLSADLQEAQNTSFERPAIHLKDLAQFSSPSLSWISARLIQTLNFRDLSRESCWSGKRLDGGSSYVGCSLLLEDLALAALQTRAERTSPPKLLQPAHSLWVLSESWTNSLLTCKAREHSHIVLSFASSSSSLLKPQWALDSTLNA